MSQKTKFTKKFTSLESLKELKLPYSHLESEQNKPLIQNPIKLNGATKQAT